MAPGSHKTDIPSNGDPAMDQLREGASSFVPEKINKAKKTVDAVPATGMIRTRSRAAREELGRSRH